MRNRPCSFPFRTSHSHLRTRMRVLRITALVVLLDQITKVWVKLTLGAADPFSRSVPIVGDLFRLTYTENPGMAFGLSVGSKLFLTLFSIVATGLIAAYLWSVRRGPYGYRVALALILGGAIGNIIDRVFYGMIWGECFPGDGYRPFYGCVVDFLHLDLWRGTLPEWLPLVGGNNVALFPIGNVADLAIIGGVAAILLFQRRFQRAMAEADGTPEPAPAAPAEPAPAAPAEPAPLASGEPPRA